MTDSLTIIAIGRDIWAMRSRDLDSLGEELRGRHDAADEPCPLGFGGIHHAAGQAQIHRLRLADKAGKALRPADAGHRAERNLGLPKSGIFGGR